MIELQNLTVRFGDKTVFENRTFRFPETGVVHLQGASGSGKTTLLRVLTGLLRPDSGTVTGLAGRKLGVVFQEDRLLPWYTARQNVALVSAPETADRLLDGMGLAGAAGLLPAELSGGMRRRVAIARALAYSDDVLLLDEPFTGLDEENRRLVAQVVAPSARLILLVSHDPEDAALLGATERIDL